MENKENGFLSLIILVLAILLLSSAAQGEKKFEEGKLVGLQMADRGYIGGYNDALNASYDQMVNQTIEAYNAGAQNGYKVGFDAGVSTFFPIWGKTCSKEELNAAHNRGFDYGLNSGLGQAKMEEDLLSPDIAEYIVLRTISYKEIAQITGRNTTSKDTFQIVIPHYKGIINGSSNDPTAGWDMPEFIWVINNSDNGQTGN